MKNKDLKKGKESIIGKIIYGFLLFMPLFAIGSACLISTFNMSGKQETEIHYKYVTNDVNSSNDLVANNIYKLNISLIGGNNYIYCSNVYCFDSGHLVFECGDEDTDYICIYLYTQNSLAIGSDYSVFGDSSEPLFIISKTWEVYAVNDSSNEFANIDDYHIFSKSDYSPIESVETHNLNAEDVFYNAVDKVEQSNLFNWSETTIIYTGIQNTCTQLGITNTFTPMLLAYWLLISVVYILYDIILMILIILHNRVHRLQDSMS